MPSGSISTPASAFVVECHSGILDPTFAGVKADRAAAGFSGRGFPDSIFDMTRRCRSISHRFSSGQGATGPIIEIRAFDHSLIGKSRAV